MRFKMAGNKRDTVALVVKNAETAASISRGQLSMLKLAGNSNDGLEVFLLSSGTNGSANSLVFGVALDTIGPLALGEVQAFGFNNYSMLRLQTRAATTDSWASGASLATGHILACDTVNNALSTAAASLAASAFLPWAILASSVASYASSASATSDTRTAITTAAKTFLRML